MSDSGRAAGSVRGLGGEAARSGTRPASARRSMPAGATRRTTAPKTSRRNGRATALGLILLALMLAYAYPVRLYLTQQAQIQALQMSQAAQRAEIKNLDQQSQEWNDPAFIKAEARARFFYVSPGTKTYVVQQAPVPPATTKTSKSTTTWYAQLWSSLRSADDPGATSGGH